MTLFCAHLPQEHWHQTELPNVVTMKLKQRRNRETIHTDIMNYTLMIVRVNNVMMDQTSMSLQPRSFLKRKLI